MFLHTEASTIYVSPDGTGDGSTEENATELQNALTSENVIAGDTIVMLDGTYTGNYSSTVTGTAEAKIYIKPKNYMQAVIDGSLQIGDFSGTRGAYTRVRNIRCYNSNAYRGAWDAPQGSVSIPPNFTAAAPYVEFINYMADDGGIGLASHQQCDNMVSYGGILFNNGWADDVLGGAQNTYWQADGKTMKHNIYAGAFKKSFAGFGTGASITNATVEENIIFERNSALIGATYAIADNIKFNENHVIGEGNTTQMGYNYKYNGSLEYKRNRTYGGAYFAFQYWNSIEASDNVFVQGEDVESHGFRWVDDRDPSAYSWAFSNNKYHYLGTTPSVAFKVEYGDFGWGSWAEWNAAGYDTEGSTYDEAKPSTNEIFVYANEYPDADDMRMGIVVIWNWEEEETVEVDLTDLGLQVGTTYRWRQAQDPLVDIDTWECDGDTHSFPMTGHTVAKPIGFDEELIPTQFPTFGCFIIEKVV